MKVVFAGPSLWGAEVALGATELRPPAAQGDVLRALDDGATVIGLIDGTFGETAAVWHKEILLALSRGLRVLGAASMGALRAAECRAFGMVAVGNIADAYCCGALIDDDAVALVHAPAEMAFMPLSEPLVNSDATTKALVHRGLVTAEEAMRLRTAARELYFAERTAARLVVRAGFGGSRTRDVLRLYDAFRVDQKKVDALQLVERVRTLPDELAPSPKTWSLRTSPVFAEVLRARRLL